MPKRNKTVIIAEILDIAKDGAGKTDIMYEAKLSYQQLNRYLPGLEKANLLEVVPFNNPDRRGLKQEYRATEEGIKFLNEIGYAIRKLKEVG